jgi:class 3 adenylate cyclase
MEALSIRYKNQASSKRPDNVRKILVTGVFWRILVIEMILLVWSLGYRAATEDASVADLFWFAVRILILVGIIIAFVTISLNRFLKRKIILPLEIISAANLDLDTDSPTVNSVNLPPDTPEEIKEIVDTRQRMLEAILKVSNERLGLVKFIRETFGRYLSKKVVDEILSSPEGFKIGGRRETVTILMADLRGFTSRTQSSDPEETLRLLNRFFGAMAKIITSYDGMIDEFLGDGILAIFGVPERHEDDPARAVACALEMQNALQRLNKELEDEAIQPLEMGIGINTGSVIVGNIGSKIRAKYGIVGMPVNTASRIESLTLGGQVLIGEPTYRLLYSNVQVESPQTVMMKGYKEPLVCFPAIAINAPYQVKLKVKTKISEHVDIQLPITGWVIDGKKVKEPSIQGKTLNVQKDLWRVELESALDPMTDLKIMINFCTEVHCFEPVYAKVMKHQNHHMTNTFDLSITAMNHEDFDIIENWVEIMSSPSSSPWL